MADFLAVWNARGIIIDTLQQKVQDRDGSHDTELGSAEKVQRAFRGQRVRKDIAKKKKACNMLSRVRRGHVGRQKSKNAKEEKKGQENMARFHYYAILTQKYFRAFYSRRYYHDFYARKKYISAIAEKGERLREELQQKLEDQYLENQRNEEEKQRTEFHKVSQNLHHLTSTKTVPGIYNSPYLAEPITAFGQPVEEHLCAGAKELLRSKQWKKSRQQHRTQMSATPPDRRSLQQASRYGIDEDRSKTEKRYSKMQNLGGTDFKAGGTSKQLHRYIVGINNGDKYYDDFRNPFKIRGVPQSGADLDVEKTTLGRYPQKPFLLSVGGNKNPVLDNDRFDVMCTQSQPNPKRPSEGPSSM